MDNTVSTEVDHGPQDLQVKMIPRQKFYFKF